MKLSAIILTKNEGENLDACLRSLHFCDEILVVDDDSIDNTKEVAHKYHAVLANRSLHNDFAAQRNFAMEKATGEWLLFVDADEEVTPELKEEIKQVIQDGKRSQVAYYIKRRDFFWGKELFFGETRSARQKGYIRLVKKGTGQWYGQIHEVFYSQASTGQLHSFLNHRPHPTLKEFLQDINVYSSIRARELYNQGKTSPLFILLAFPMGKFLYTYIGKMGWRDGAEGFVYSFMMSFHSFLVRAKLYQYKEIGDKI